MHSMLYKNMITLPKCTTVDTTDLQPGGLIHTYFDFYNVTSTWGLTSMITVVCEKNRTIWVFNNIQNIPSHSYSTYPKRIE